MKHARSLRNVKGRLKVAVLFGGPSPERGISLNSARSVCDHLEGDDVEVIPIYFDFSKRAYLISRAQLYSNTPSDFDFKLHSSAEPLSQSSLLKLLRSVQIAFPAMHGRFGEDGGIQSLLERARVPFVGSGSIACSACFDKFEANQTIQRHGFFALPSHALNSKRDLRGKIAAFFKKYRLTQAIVKPASGGSSIGVFAVSSVAEACQRASDLLDSGVYQKVVIEERCVGSEFTVVLLQNRFDIPVALIPVEIEADYSQHQIFDYRKKYLPTRQVVYHCPPRFENRILEKIMAQAESLFALFGMRDFARFDGWVRPDGNIWFSDFNPVSGMEQNSFLFLQSARVGMTHRDVLRYVVWHACHRANIRWEAPKVSKRIAREEIPVIFGGDTAERQVSVMSGTNVWLKLRRSDRFEPKPFLLDTDGSVWDLPYEFTLNHTVEEISEMVRKAPEDEPRVAVLRRRVLNRLQPQEQGIGEEQHVPHRMSLSKFLEGRKFVFIGLHGGKGEDGTFQALCEERGIRFNGPGSKASRLCMNKNATAEAVMAAHIAGVSVPQKFIIPSDRFAVNDSDEIWRSICSRLPGQSFIVKPIGDGCSSGIARLHRASDLARYFDAVLSKVQRIQPGTLTNQDAPIEMPVVPPREILIEEFIHTDRVRVVRDRIEWERVSGWIEITVGVVGRLGAMRALNPSITVAEGDVLSVEEKFQGGTGVNITPPPPDLVPARIVARAKQLVERIAAALQLESYARLDLFLEISTGNVKLIEVNTLPALTPSTVLFHQALAEKRPRYPREFIEFLIDISRTAT